MPPSPERPKRNLDAERKRHPGLKGVPQARNANAAPSPENPTDVCQDELHLRNPHSHRNVTWTQPELDLLEVIRKAVTATSIGFPR
jgi:hypothetical protein